MPELLYQSRTKPDFFMSFSIILASLMTITKELKTSIPIPIVFTVLFKSSIEPVSKRSLILIVFSDLLVSFPKFL